MSPAPALPPEADDDRFAPVEFIDCGAGRTVARLGAFDVGEILDAGEVDRCSYVVRLTGVPDRWRRNAPINVARDTIVAVVRDWIDGARIADWLKSREAARSPLNQRQGRR